MFGWQRRHAARAHLASCILVRLGGDKRQLFIFPSYHSTGGSSGKKAKADDFLIAPAASKRKQIANEISMTY